MSVSEPNPAIYTYPSIIHLFLTLKSMYLMKFYFVSYI